MSAVALASTKDLSREQWLAVRRQGIGSSDAAAIAGLNPYLSPMRVWLDKTGQLPEQEPNERMYWGAVLEDVVAREFSLRTGLKVRRRNAVLQSAAHPWMLANLDRECYGDGSVGVLECKTTSAWHAHDWDDGRVPDMYAIQVHHQLAVTGYRYGWIAVLIGGNDFRMARIERDPEIVDYLVRIEADFWRLVESRTPPEVDGTDASSEALRLLYPQAEPRKQAVLPLELEAEIAAYRQAKAEAQAAEQRAQLAAQRIQDALGDAEEGLIAGEVRVTWRNVTSQRLDTQRLKVEMPDIYSRFAKETSARRFLVKE